MTDDRHENCEFHSSDELPKSDKPQNQDNGGPTEDDSNQNANTNDGAALLAEQSKRYFGGQHLENYARLGVEAQRAVESAYGRNLDKLLEIAKPPIPKNLDGYGVGVLQPHMQKLADEYNRAFTLTPTFDPSRFFAPVLDAKALLGEDAWESLTGKALQRSLDKTYADFAAAAKAAASLSPMLEAAKKVSQQYAGLVPDSGDDAPLPYLEKFHGDFLTLFAMLVLAASRVENLMADLCEVHFGVAQFEGATYLAHASFGRMRGYLEKHAGCQACRELAAETEDPIDFRNALVHGDWLIGGEIASEEQKARHSWLKQISMVTRVVRRKPLGKKAFSSLQEQWSEGKPQTLRDLFTSQVVSIGLVSAHVEKFTELGDRCEEELARHTDK